MKNSPIRYLSKSIATMLAASGCLALPALALPKGAQVVHGSGSFSGSGDQLTIRAGNNAIINYQSFNIGKGEIVRFLQPDSNSKVLNRVLDGDPTHIFGTLQANGQVYLINPGGIFFENGSVINVGSIMAGAGVMTDADFLSGTHRFSDLSGELVNRGSLTASGDVGLFGSTVLNMGAVSSKRGVVAMVAGGEVLLGEKGGNVYVKASPAAGATAPAPAAGLQQQGQVTARRVVLAAGDLYGLTLGSTSSVTARNIAVQGGQGTTVQVAGTLNASAATGHGGLVKITGEKVNLTGAKIAANGPRGGGKVLVGGAFQGTGDTPRAQTTSVDAATTITADATVNGDGGRVILWSDGATQFAGSISAKGAGSGKGGFSEVSGKGTLSDTGLVDLTAPSGHTGRLLLDPDKITVVSGSADNLAVLNAPGDASVNDADGTGNQSLTNGFLVKQLDLANITLQATTSIELQAAIDASANTAKATTNSLTLKSAQIIFDKDANITLKDGTLTLDGPVSLKDAGLISLSTGNGSVSFLNPVTGLGSLAVMTAKNISFAAGAGVTLQDGALALQGTIKLPDTGTLTLSTGTGAITLQGAVSGKAGLTVNTTGGLTFGDGSSVSLQNGALSLHANVTLPDTGTLSLATGTGAVLLDGSLGGKSGLKVTTTGNITFNAGSSVTLTDSSLELHGGIILPATGNTISFSTGTGTVLLAGAVTGAGGLSITGTGLTTFSGAVGTAATRLDSLAVGAGGADFSGDVQVKQLSVSGPTQLETGANVTTTSTQTYSGGLTTAGDHTLTGATVTLGGKISVGGDDGAADLNVVGNLAFAHGADYFVTLRANRQDVIKVTGNTTIPFGPADATVEGFIPDGNSGPKANQSVTLLTGTGQSSTRTGNFAGGMTLQIGGEASPFQLDYSATELKLSRGPAQFTWTGAKDDLWSTHGNWSLLGMNTNLIPGDGDSVIFADGNGAKNPATRLDIDDLDLTSLDFQSGTFSVSTTKGGDLVFTGGANPIILTEGGSHVLNVPITISGDSIVAITGLGFIPLPPLPTTSLQLGNTISSNGNVTFAGLGGTLRLNDLTLTTTKSLTFALPVEGGGNVSLSAKEVSFGFAGVIPALNLGTVKNLTVITDKLDLGLLSGAPAGAGTLTVAPLTAGTNLVVGQEPPVGGFLNLLGLPPSLLSNFQAVKFGNATTGNVEVDALPAAADVTVTSGQDIVLNNSLNVNSLTLSSVGLTKLNGVTITTAAAQTYTGPVSVTASSTLDATGGAVKLAGLILLADLDVKSSGQNITFGGAITGTGSLTTETSGVTQFNDTVQAGGVTTKGGGGTTIAKSITTSGGQNYAGNVTISSPATLTFGNFLEVGGVTTLNGKTDLVAQGVNTTIQFADTVTANAPFSLQAANGGTHLTFGKDALLNGGAQIDLQGFGNNVTFTAGATLGSGSLVSAGGFISGVSFGGPTTFSAGVGTTQVFGSEVTFAKAVDVNGATTISTGGLFNDVTFSGPTSLKASLAVNAGTSGKVTFADTVSGDSALTTTAGLTEFDVSVGSLGSLQVSGTALLKGDVHTSGNQTYNNLVRIENAVPGAETRLMADNGSTIDLSGKIALSNNLTVQSGSGAISFGDQVTGLFALVADTSGDKFFQAVGAAGAPLQSLTTKGGGLTIFAGPVFTQSGLDLQDNVQVTQEASLNTVAGDISFGGTLETLAPLTINAGGNATFAHDINTHADLTVNPMGSATFSGPIHLGGGTVQPGGSLTVVAPGSLVTFDPAATVDGEHSLNVAAAQTNFNSLIGSTSPLQSISVAGQAFLHAPASFTTSPDGAPVLTTASIVTTGAQTFTGAVTLGSDTWLESTGTAGITFSAPVGAHDAYASNAGEKLVLRSNGTIQFQDSVGAGAVAGELPLAYFYAGTVSPNAPKGKLVLDGSPKGLPGLEFNTGSGNVGPTIFGSPLQLNGNVTIGSKNSDPTLDGGVRFAKEIFSTVPKSGKLTVLSSGDVTFEGSIGGADPTLGTAKPRLPLGGLTVSLADLAHDRIVFDAGSSGLRVGTSGGQDYRGIVDIQGHVTLSSAESSIDLPEGVKSTPKMTGPRNSLTIRALGDDVATPGNLAPGDIEIGAPVTGLNALDVMALHDAYIHNAAVDSILSLDAGDHLYLVGNVYQAANQINLNTRESHVYDGLATIVHNAPTTLDPLFDITGDKEMGRTQDLSLLVTGLNGTLQMGPQQALYVDKGNLTISAVHAILGDVAAQQNIIFQKSQTILLRTRPATGKITSAGIDQGVLLLAGGDILYYTLARPQELRSVPSQRAFVKSGAEEPIPLAGNIVRQFGQDRPDPVQPVATGDETVPPVVATLPPNELSLSALPPVVVTAPVDNGDLQGGAIAPSIAKKLGNVGIYPRAATAEENDSERQRGSAIFRQPPEGQAVMENPDYEVVLNRVPLREMSGIVSLYEQIAGVDGQQWQPVLELFQQTTADFSPTGPVEDEAKAKAFAAWLTERAGANPQAASALETLQRLHRLLLEIQDLKLTEKEVAVAWGTIADKFDVGNIDRAARLKLITAVKPAPVTSKPLHLAALSPSSTPSPAAAAPAGAPILGTDNLPPVAQPAPAAPTAEPVISAPQLRPVPAETLAPSLPGEVGPLPADPALSPAVLTPPAVAPH